MAGEITQEKLRSIIESLLFANDKPLRIKDIEEIIGGENKEIEPMLEGIKNDYVQKKSGLNIIKVAGGYQMCTSADNEEWVRKLFQQRRKQKLSLAALETLAIIAYKQPITKMEIETIRGVNADGVIKNLFTLALIKIGGKKEVVGRPYLYITTRKFLEYFGLNNLKELPKLEDFVTMAKQTELSQENDSIETYENKEVVQ